MTEESINKGNPLERTNCPIRIEELRRLYVDEGNSYNEIAIIISKRIGKESSFSQSLIGKWIRIAGISTRTPSEALLISKSHKQSMQTQKRDCPVSKEMLIYMYWKQGYTYQQIADLLTVRTESQIRYFQHNVLAWFREKNIAARTNSQAQILKTKQDSNLRKIRTETLKSACVKGGKSVRCTKKHLTNLQKEGSKRHAELCRERRMSTKCAWYECGKMLSLKPSMVKKNNFCCLSCSTKYFWREKKLNKLRTAKPSTAPTDQQTKEWAERILGRKVV